MVANYEALKIDSIYGMRPNICPYLGVAGEVDLHKASWIIYRAQKLKEKKHYERRRSKTNREEIS